MPIVMRSTCSVTSPTASPSSCRPERSVASPQLPVDTGDNDRSSSCCELATPRNGARKDMSAPATSGAELTRESGDLGTPIFEPYIPDKAELRELTWPAVVMGSLLG